MSDLLHALILEDNKNDALLLKRELHRGGFKLESLVVDNATDMRNALQERKWDVILSDYSMPGFDAPAALKIAQEHGDNIPFIIVSGTVGEDVAVTAMKAGAHDFFTKDKLKRLVPVVERELREAQVRRDRNRAEQIAQATLDALSAHIAILDESGKIVSVNQAWIDFAQENQDKGINNTYVGYNYLTVCDNACSDDIDSDNREIATLVASAIRRIIDGAQDYFELEYPCHWQTKYQWFTVKITRFRNQESARVVVAHENVTDRKLAEEQTKRANGLISLLRDIAVASNEAVDIHEILQFTINRICNYANWDIGHAYIVPTNNRFQLESIPIWHISDDDCFREFRQFTDTVFDAAHKGLIRRVLETKNAEWLEDVTNTDQFIRADLAAACGLRSGHAFPIIAYQNVVGVLEFFSKQSLNELAQEIGVVTTHIGSQVGRVIERQRARAALKESEERYRALFDRSLNAVYIHDFDGNLIDANPVALELFGYDVDNIEQLNFISLLLPEESEKVSNTLQDIISSGYQQEATEFQLRRKDNTTIYVETISSVIYRDGKPWAIQGIARDITEQKRAHKEEQSRRIFAEALNHTTTLVLAGDFDRENVLNVILEYAAVLIPCDAATLMEVQSGVAHVIGSTGYANADLKDILNFTMIVEETKNLRLMAETGKPVIVYDTETFAEWHTDKIPKLTEIRSNLGAPIFIGDRLFGFINLDSFVPNHFTQNHANQLALLCNQAAIAIHNAQQYVQKKQYAKRLELLHKIDKAILRADQPQEIATVVLKQLHSFTDYYSATVTIYDLESEQQTVLASTTSTPATFLQGNTYKIEYEKLITTLQEKRTYIVEDLLQKQTLSWLEEDLVTAGVRSYICIPMMVGDSLLGSLNFRFQNAYKLSPEELDIAQEVAAQLAIAIENARLLEVEQRRNSELTAIHQASLQLTSTLDLDMVLHTILDYAILLVDAYDAHIFLYDGEKLTFGAAQWDGQRQSKPLAEPRPDGLTKRVAQSGKRTVINDMSSHPAYRDTIHRGAIIGLPLTVAERVSGVMNMAFLNTRVFDENEIRLLELLADQAAIAIHNAQLYQQIQAHAEELEQRVFERTQQLQRAKEHVEGIFNASNDSLILVDMNGKIYQTNPGFTLQFGYPPDEVYGKSLEALIMPEYVEQFRSVFDTVIEEKSSHRIEIVARRRDHSVFPADALFAPMMETGTVDIVCSLRDITLQKQVELELREALTREKELNELKTQFTSIVSHEFRTPLAVILSSSDTLYHYSDRLSREKQLTKLQQIKDQVQRLTQLMDDVLLITRSESVGFEFKPQQIDILNLCERIIEEIQARNVADIPIVFSHEGNCQAVMLDEFLFSHIFQNIGSNAIKYSRASSQVFIHLQCLPTEVRLKVEDQGIGIPQDHQAKLFESFQRASNVGQIQGTGIGMTIVKRAIDAHKGKIEFSSVENEGTTFVVTLPIEPA